MAGDTIRRLLSRTIAQQIRDEGHSTVPICFVHRAGCECIAHAIQAMTDAPRCTVLVPHMEGGDGVLPFICGRILKEWSTKFCKERTGNRAIL